MKSARCANALCRPHGSDASSVLLRVILAGCALFHTGCKFQQREFRPEVARDIATSAKGELTEVMADFVQLFQVTVETAATEIERKASSNDQRKAAALWRIRMNQECRATAGQDDPREVLVDLWTLCYRMHAFLSEGEGRSAFGELQPVAVAASDKLDQAMEHLVQRYVAKDALAHAKEQVVAFSRAHPIRAEFVATPTERLSDRPEVAKALRNLVAMPLAPFTALRAIGKTPETIHDASSSVLRFSQVLEDLPASARWELQLLGMNLGESVEVTNTLRSLAQLSDSSALVAHNSSQFVRIADELPERVRTQAEALLKRADESQPQLQLSLREAQISADKVRSASEDIRATVADADCAVANVQQSARALEHAANAVTVTAREILKFVPASMKDETGQVIGRAGDHTEPLGTAVSPSAPKSEALRRSASGPSARAPGQENEFSFQAVTESANSLGAATEKLQRFLADLRAFADDRSISSEAGAVDSRLRGAVDFSAGQLRGVVDHAALRSAQLFALVFSLLVAYRFVAARLMRPRTGS